MRVGTAAVAAAFIAILAGRFTLSRAGLEVPLIDDVRWLLLWMIGVLALAELHRARTAAAVPPMSRAAVTALCFFSYLALSSAWSPPGSDLTAAMSDLVGLAVFVFVYDALARVDRDRTVHLTMLLLVATGLLYFASAAAGLGRDSVGRWAAFGGGPNVFVRVMALGVIACVYLYLTQLRFWWLLPVPLYLVGAVLSGSRGGLVAAAVTLLYLVVTNLNRLSTTALIRLVLLIPILLVVTVRLGGERLKAMVEDRYVAATYEERYTSTRDVLYERAVELFMQRPVTGTGVGGYAAQVVVAGQVQYAHNLALSVGAEGGLVGLLLLLVAIGSAVRGYALQRGRASLAANAALLSALYIGCASLFSGDYYDSRFMWVFLVLASYGLGGTARAGQPSDAPALEAAAPRLATLLAAQRHAVERKRLRPPRLPR